MRYSLLFLAYLFFLGCGNNPPEEMKSSVDQGDSTTASTTNDSYVNLPSPVQEIMKDPQLAPLVDPNSLEVILVDPSSTDLKFDGESNIRITEPSTDTTQDGPILEIIIDSPRESINQTDK